MMLRRRLLLAAGLAAGLAIPSLAIPAFAEDATAERDTERLTVLTLSVPVP